MNATTIFRGGLLLLLGSTASMAADLPRRASPPPFVAVPTFTWTGFYAGVNAGGGFDTGGNTGNGRFGSFTGEVAPVPGGGLAPLTAAGGSGVNTRRDGSGFTGGGQIGYNYQFGVGSGVVIGIEGDIQYTDFGGSRSSGNNNNGVFAVTPSGGPAVTGFGVAPTTAGGVGNIAFFNNGLNATRTMDYYGTIRGRLGYAFDRVLVYATGGAAFFDNSSNNNGLGAFGGSGVTGPFFVSPAAAAAGTGVVGTFARSRSTDIGYVVGGGAEYAMTDNITARIEGFYVDRDRGGRNNGGGNQVVGVTNTGAPVFATASRRGSDESFAVIRAGLNYKFNLF